MKVPVTGRVAPPRQGLGYLRAVTPDYRGGIAQGLVNVGDAVSGFAARVQARQDDTNKIKALAAFSQFETDTSVALTELKRTAPPDGANYVPQAMSVYGTKENEFLAGLPSELQEEYTARVSAVRQRAELDAYEFQFTQQDAFFETNIKAEYEKAKVELANNPEAFDAYTGRLAEFIMAADIPAASKAEFARTMHTGLAAIVYGKEVEGIRRDVGATDFVGKIINIESGGNAAARNPNSTATGAGQFIESTWREFISEAHPELLTQGGDIQKLRTDAALSEEAVEWYANKNAQALTAAGQPVTEGALYLSHFLGTAGGPQMLAADPTATAASVNPGAASANKSVFYHGGDTSKPKTVQEVIDWANRKMGGADAVTDLDNDPRFAGLTLEDREAMIHDADTRVSNEETEAAKLLKAQQDAQRNDLYTSLLDGPAGQSAIDAARKAGLLTDIDDIEKAQKILEDREGNQDSAAAVQAILDSKGALIYNPSVHADGFNKLIGKQGLEQIGAGNQDYMNGVVLPAIQQLQDVPTDVVGQLLGMTRSSDPLVMRGAYANLAAIEDVAPGAYASRVDEALAAKVDNYRNMRLSATDEELNNYLRGGRNAAEAQVSATLDKEAAAIVKDLNVPNVVTDLTYGFDPGVGNWTAVQVDIEREFVSAFKFNYRATRDESAAKQAALRQMQRVWGNTLLGSGKRLMRFPPEKIYPTLTPPGNALNPFGATGFEGYEDQARTDLSLLDEEDFQLVADEQTLKEVRAYKAGELPRLPSYSVVKFTVDGVPVPITQRWYGDASARTE